MSKPKIISYEVDLSNLLPLTEKQKAEIKMVAAMPDSEIRGLQKNPQK